MSTPFALATGRPVTSTPSAAPRGSGWPIIAFCHLPWHGVWQRPQQLLSRLSRDHPVLFVECECRDVPAAYVSTYTPANYPGVTVLTMHLPAAQWADGDFIDFERRRLLASYRSANAAVWRGAVLWFNDPMAVNAFAGCCGERAIVYDCMDELTQFAGAPAGLAEREQLLLAHADVVFCGGRKMRDKRLPLNANTHFYGTGVDFQHFSSALDPALVADPAVAALRGPVFGYFGVIDERIDYGLLSHLADTLSHCSIAMIGPTVKVNPADLPQRPNLHWLGPRPYAQLPEVARGFAVCLMPFARNAATEYINPTKALEYFATGRPVVSTALDEVKSNFGDICHIATSHHGFIARCWEQIVSPDSARIRRGLERAVASSWEAVVAEMSAHIDAVLAGRAKTAEVVAHV